MSYNIPEPSAITLGIFKTENLEKYQQAIGRATGITNFCLFEGNIDTSYIFYKQSKSIIRGGPRGENPFHGEGRLNEIPIRKVEQHGALSQTLLDMHSQGDAKVDHAEIFDRLAVDYLYLIFTGLGVAVANQFFGAMASEAGKDIYKSIKDALKNLKSFQEPEDSYNDNPLRVVEVCIQVHHSKYIVIFNPDLENIDDDLNRIHQFLIDNTESIDTINNQVVDIDKLSPKND